VQEKAENWVLAHNAGAANRNVAGAGADETNSWLRVLKISAVVADENTVVGENTVGLHDDHDAAALCAHEREEEHIEDNCKMMVMMTMLLEQSSISYCCYDNDVDQTVGNHHRYRREQ